MAGGDCDIDYPVTTTAAHNDISEESTSDESYDSSDDGTPLAPISKQSVLFAMNMA
jgi:hypothetical protein